MLLLGLEGEYVGLIICYLEVGQVRQCVYEKDQRRGKHREEVESGM